MDLPALDQNICGSWSQLQKDTYNTVPYYLMSAQARYRREWATFSRLFGKVKWTPNAGPKMRTIMQEFSPVIRQDITPRLIDATPLVDVYATLERKSDAYLYAQDFVSPVFHFYPEFNDFARHVTFATENINRQMIITEDTFYRSVAWYKAPYVWVSGKGLVASPTALPHEVTATYLAKTNAWLQAQLVDCAATGTYLTFQELFKVANAAENEVGMTPYDGSGMPQSDSNPLNEKYCLVTSSQTWNNFVDDPWLKENRPLNMNIVTDYFKGDFWGKIRTKLQRYPQRMKVDANYLPSFPAPENIQVNPESEMFNRTQPNPEYADPAKSPFEIHYYVGGSSYDVIEVGPPPPAFAKTPEAGRGAAMEWNGKAYITKNVPIKCKDSQGNDQWDLNSFGRYLRIQGSLALGMRGVNQFNVLPIITKRRAQVTTVS